MAPAKLERIISVSSEDPAYPADNLLKNAYSDKKWKSKSLGEKQISVVIQLEKAEKINAIDVGNCGSAFVEILVSKSSSPDDFKPLVVSSTLMTLQEAKLAINTNSVRFFKENILVKETASEKWDRIKIVCSQPYNKQIQFGLSFIVIHPANNSSSFVHSPTLGKYHLKKNDSSDNLTIGSLFAKRKENGTLELKGAAAIRAASTSGILDKKTVTQIRSRSPVPWNSNAPGPEDRNTSITSNELRKITPKALNKDEPKNKVNGTTASESSSTRSINNKRAADKIKENIKKKPIPKKRLEKQFNKLLDGVVFTISGFQNPYRSEIRSKALEMGAKYRPDWDNSCTHLLCAFPNTPKFNQVLGHGKIITKDWIEICYDRRIRLPWRRYALHPPDKALPESEEEIFELVERPPPIDNRRRISSDRSSGEDTEDEIKRVLEVQGSKKGGNKHNTPNTEINLPKDNRCGNYELGASTKDSTTDVNCSKIYQFLEINKPTVGCFSNYTEIEKGSGPINLDNKLPKKSKKNQKDKTDGCSKTSDSSSSMEIEMDSELINVNNKSPKKKKKIKKDINPSTSDKFSLCISKGTSECADVPESEVKNSMEITEQSGPLSKKLRTEETYDLETEEEDEASDSVKWDLPHLVIFFDSFKFYIGDDLNDHLQKKLNRYILAHKGQLINEDDLPSTNDVNYVVTESKEVVNKVKVNSPSAIGVKPDWVWKAHDENRIPPISSKFEI